MRVFYAAMLTLFAAMIVIFCIQNFQSVSVDFLGWSASLPLAILVVLIYLFGMVSGWGLVSFLRRAMRRASEKKE